MFLHMKAPGLAKAPAQPHHPVTTTKAQRGFDMEFKENNVTTSEVSGVGRSASVTTAFEGGGHITVYFSDLGDPNETNAAERARIIAKAKEIAGQFAAS